jgi:hypothetical protein
MIMFSACPGAGCVKVTNGYGPWHVCQRGDEEGVCEDMQDFLCDSPAPFQAMLNQIVTMDETSLRWPSTPPDQAAEEAVAGKGLAWSHEGQGDARRKKMVLAPLL